MWLKLIVILSLLLPPLATARVVVIDEYGQLNIPACCLVEWRLCAGKYHLAAYLKEQEDLMAKCQGCGADVTPEEPGFVRRDHPDLPFFCYTCNQAFDRGELRRLNQGSWIRLNLGETP